MFRTYSIIVPMYNVQTYIAECIESVIMQTYPKWELLIVDDESEDGSLEIARKYAKEDSRIKIITKQHGGLPQTRNYGLRQASGEFVLLLDGDDYFAADHLEKCNAILDSDCDMCIFNNHVNFTSKESEKIVLFPTYSGINELSKKKKMNIIFSLDNYLPANAVLTIYRRQFLLENNIKYSEEYRCSEDLDFFLNNIIYAKNILFADHTFYYYRQDNIGAMTKNISGAMLLDRLTIYEKWYQVYKNNQFDGFDGNVAAKLFGRDMRTSIKLYYQLDGDKDRDMLKKYIYDTRYIWETKKLKDSYFFVMIIRVVIRKIKAILLMNSKRMVKNSGKFK